MKLLETSGQVYTDYYTLGDTVDYYYGPLVPSAGYLKVWGLERYQDGLLLRVPDKHNPLVLAERVDQPRTYEVFAEKVRWDIIMRLSNAGDVNKAILRGYASELIQREDRRGDRCPLPSEEGSHQTRADHGSLQFRKVHFLQTIVSATPRLWTPSPLFLYRRLLREPSGYAETAKWTV